jgi:hypothetical protein
MGRKTSHMSYITQQSFTRCATLSLSLHAQDCIQFSYLPPSGPGVTPPRGLRLAGPSAPVGQLHFLVNDPHLSVPCRIVEHPTAMPGLNALGYCPVIRAQ